MTKESDINEIDINQQIDLNHKAKYGHTSPAEDSDDDDDQT